VDSYNERKETTVCWSVTCWKTSPTGEIVDLIQALKKNASPYADLGIDLKKKLLRHPQGPGREYDFTYPEDKLVALAAAVKTVVDDKVSSTPTGAAG